MNGGQDENSHPNTQYLQSTRRTLELPIGCGIEPREVPKNIYYYKPRPPAGDYFSVEITLNKTRFRKKSSKSIAIPLRNKLNQAKDILNELRTQHTNCKGSGLL